MRPYDVSVRAISTDTPALYHHYYNNASFVALTYYT
jgi:hypothetical protein